MIVVPQDRRVLVITQSDHAQFAAELFSLWRAQRFPEHPRRREILFAIREHDNGWREADAAPRLDPASGLPFDFIGYPDDLRAELWTRGIERFAGEHPWAALLILTHAREIHRRRSSRPEWKPFFDELDTLEERLLQACDGRPEDLRSDYEYLELADSLSLLACLRGGRSSRIRQSRARFDGETLAISPFPLAGSTTFDIPCRWIPNRRYSSDVEVTVALVTSRWTETRVKVVPEEG